MRGLVVTGTDTNVGKSVVSAAIMIRYRRLGLRYWKPVQTGIEVDDDTSVVRRLAGGCETIDAGVRLPRPLSPHLSARLAGQTISVSALCAISPNGRTLVVEGAGGVLVPLNDRELMVDLISALALPALIVGRNALGTINHTLLTIDALRSRSIAVAGVVLVGEPNRDHCEAIEAYGGVPVIGEMPRFERLDETLPAWAATTFDRGEALAEVLR